MANNPHFASLASSLSTSPFATQSNLEQLIQRSRQYPHARRSSDLSERFHHGFQFTPTEAPQDTRDDDSPTHESAPPVSASRRASQFEPGARIGTIREASYDDGAAILIGDEDDMDDAADERSGLLPPRRESRRRSYGSTSEPIGARTGRRRSDVEHSTKKAEGNSRSRSKARTPPRRDPVPQLQGDSASSLNEEVDHGRGRCDAPRPLSPISTKYAESTHARRRSSIATRFADDSSGDEGGDVARGLVATGGGAMFGGRAGLGMTPASGNQGTVGHMDLDPAEALDAVDLELPVADDGLEARDWTEALRAEIPVICRMSVPVFASQLAEWSLVLASVVSIGHLGTTELAASSLASMTASVSSFSILQGLATALDTLLPAAWTSSDPSRVGLWTQRTAVVMSVSMIPMFVLWWNINGVLLALGQETAVANKAAAYLKYLSMGIPGYAGTVLLKKYLQAQNLMHIPTYILFVISPTNLLLNYLLVWGPKAIRLGFVGGAVATATSFNLNFILLLIYALYYGPKEAFHPLTFATTFSKLGTVTSLGLAGTIMASRLSSEWWAWEACALAASLLGPTTLAAQSVLLSTASTFFQVPASLGIASAVRTGNLLGAGRGWEAKWASRASLILSVVLALFTSAICLIFRKRWGYLFNSDDEVVAIVASVMPYIALFQITDGIGAAAGSILRSLGLHTTGALINLTSYYIIGLPFGLWLTFTPRFSLGLVGLWIGLSVALGYGSFVSALLVWRADWPRAVERVRERLGLGTHGQLGADGKWEDEQARGLLNGDDEDEAHGTI